MLIAALEFTRKSIGSLPNQMRISLIAPPWNGYSQNMKFVGLKNYIRLFQDANVKTAFVNTLIYGVVSTIIQNILGLAYALFLNMNFKCRTIVRTIIYMPVMIAPLIMGYIMYFFFQFHIL